MLVAGASSVVALGVGLLIGAFAINTGGGNEFAYQAKIKNFNKISILVQNCITLMIFISWWKDYKGNAEEFLKNNIDNMSIRSWLGLFSNK